MNTTLSLIILMTSILGFALVGSALAQPNDDAGPAIEAPADTAPALDTTPEAEEAVDTTAPIESAVPAEEVAPTELVEQGKELYKNVKGGYWLLAFGFFGMILGSLARLTFGKKWAFLKTKPGGYTIAGFTGMGTLGTLIVEAGAFSISMIPTALLAMTAAMAMHAPAKAIAKKLAGPTTEA